MKNMKGMKRSRFRFMPFMFFMVYNQTILKQKNLSLQKL